MTAASELVGVVEVARKQACLEICHLSITEGGVGALRTLEKDYKNESIKTAVNMPNEWVSTIRRLLGSEPDVQVIGPIVGAYKAQLGMDREFRQNDFQGDSLASRLTAPNCIAVNYSGREMICEFRCGLSRPTLSLTSNLDTTGDESILVGESWEDSRSTGHKRVSLRVRHGAALLFSPDLSSHRLLGAGQITIIRGYFRAKRDGSVVATLSE